MGKSLNDQITQFFLNSFKTGIGAWTASSILLKPKDISASFGILRPQHRVRGLCSQSLLPFPRPFHFQLLAVHKVYPKVNTILANGRFRGFRSEN